MKNTEITTISEYVKKDLENSVFSNVREYAKDKNVSYTVIYDVLNGKYDNPSPLSASRICVWLNLEPEYIFSLIKNVNEAYVDEFYTYFYGKDYEDYFRSNIELFFKENNHDELYDEEPYEDRPYYDYTINNLKIVDVSKKSTYDGHSYNATGEYTTFKTIAEVEGKDLDEMSFAGSYYTKEDDNHEFALYFLPARRIYDHNRDYYPDEWFRDFTTKLLYIITDPDAPTNNIFYTNSKKLFDEIVKYTNRFNLECSNGAGVGLVYFQYKHPIRYESIIENKDLIQGKLF